MAGGYSGDIGKKHAEPGWMQLWCKVTVSSGTPTLASGVNVSSVARASEGKWTITVAEEYQAFMGGRVSYLAGTTEVGRKHQFGAAAAGSTKTITLWFYDTASPGNLRDPPDVTVFVVLDMREWAAS
jgi:hypothetical protein